MSIDQRIEQLVADFNQIQNWEDRYRKIIQMGKSLSEMDEALKIDSNKVKGCQSQVWLHAELEAGKVKFMADSDASIVKGIISILLQVYSDTTPDEILQTKPQFLDDIGLRQHLSMSRANGLSAMVKQISIYALAFQTKIKMGLA